MFVFAADVEHHLRVVCLVLFDLYATIGGPYSRAATQTRGDRHVQHYNARGDVHSGSIRDQRVLAQHNPWHHRTMGAVTRTRVGD
jgi:hypothetical protein